MRDKARALYRDHQEFILLLVLFVVFRWLAVVAYRPGGLVLDFSDFYFYRVFAQLTRAGYYPYVNLWTAYPPIYPYLMISLYKISALLPPWNFENLWFTLLLGSTLLIFETGNLVLIYATAGLFYPRQTALRCGWFYAGLFVPVYTLTGWFEGFPLFFFLLTLYLLLRRRLLLSSFVAGVGFMIKLIPVILLPVGVRLSGLDLARFRSTRGKWENFRRAALYVGVFFATILAIGLPFYFINPRLVLASPRMAASRAPWETVWALLEGEYGYGIIAADMRDLTRIGVSPAPARLPWPLISVVFAALYLWLYTRPFDWEQPRKIFAFAGLSMNLFILYSKGYSPQFLVWLLPFLVILLPNLRGAFYALLLSLANIVEANFYFIMFPDQHWLLFVTVILRTVLLIVSCLEYILILFPAWESGTVQRARRWLMGGVAVAVLAVAVFGTPRLLDAYFASRLEQSPYRRAIETLQQEATPGAALILQDHVTYDWLYPYLRKRVAFYLGEDYAMPGETVEQRMAAKVESWAADHDELWLVDDQPQESNAAEETITAWLDEHCFSLPTRQADSLRLAPYLTSSAFTPLAPSPELGEVAALVGYRQQLTTGQKLRLTLLWRAAGSDERDYTVFLHLLDSQGQLVAGQDNAPWHGALPTTQWQPGQYVADPYELQLPPDAPAGPYQFEVGMYDAHTGQRLPVSPGGDRVLLPAGP
jgi:hypothetical protein